MSERCRFRDLGLTIGKFATGPHNAITDVKGVRVGHLTKVLPARGDKNGDGAIRTGVTTILPSEDIFDHKYIGSGFVLNGAGELAGMTQLMEWGLLETPIALTNTMSVGRVSDGVARWMAKKYDSIWDDRVVVIPVVGECDDSYLNDVLRPEITKEDVFAALEKAKDGPVEEGSIGSGTGMVCCDFKGGIGTSSRIVRVEDTDYTLGVLVMSNFGYMEDLRVDGFPVGRALAPLQGKYRRRANNYGSIIVVIATDMPLAPSQIARVCKRAALGLGRMGSYADNGSGEILMGFSTANRIAQDKKAREYSLQIIHDEYLGGAYQASIECTEEAVINSLTASGDMEGVDGNWVPGINLEELQKRVEAGNKLFS